MCVTYHTMYNMVKLVRGSSVQHVCPGPTPDLNQCFGHGH